MRVFVLSIIVCLVLLTALPAAAVNYGGDPDNGSRQSLMAAADAAPEQSDDLLPCEGPCCDETLITHSPTYSRDDRRNRVAAAAKAFVSKTSYHSIEPNCVWLPPKA